MLERVIQRPCSSANR